MCLFFKLLAVASLAGLLVAWLGFIGPWCISSTHTELIIGWSVATVILALIGISILAQKLTAFFKPRTNQDVIDFLEAREAEVRG